MRAHILLDKVRNLISVAYFSRTSKHLGDLSCLEEDDDRQRVDCNAYS